ncbi:MAG TPA: sulfatase [Gemmataceae bacterium]|nr:sulfatase [Gemmataceae bacterium]
MFSLVLSIISIPSGIAREIENRPNVVLILADDLGYGDLGCFGATDVRTPHIDRLAGDGTRFTHFTVAQPVCTASRAALMTGCYPNRVGLAGALNHTSTVGIHPDEVLLPELLKAKGYATALFGKWHLGTRPAFFPTRHGFDRWAGLPYSNDNGPLHPTVRGIPPLPWFENDTRTETDPDQAQFTKRITDLAVTFIAANKDRPFFLYLPHVMPHVPVFASEAFRGKSARGRYGDAVEELDWSVGEVVKALNAAGVADRTLVLFLSDNGPFLSYGNHAGSAGRLREGKLTTFEGGVRVPCVARWPGRVPAGRVCDDLVTGLDLLPTLAALAGADLSKAKIDGLDLSPLLLGRPDAKGRPSFAYFSGSELHAVRTGRWKLHFAHPYLTVNGPPGRDGKPANFEKMAPEAIEESGIRGIASRHGYRVETLKQSLFDLTADPGETTDVSDRHPAVVKELSDLATAVRADLGDALTGVKGTGLRPVGRDEAKK